MQARELFQRLSLKSLATAFLFQRPPVSQEKANRTEESTILNQKIFRTRDEFEKLIEEDALLEYARYVENYYGTPRSYVEEQLQAGRNVILEIEIQGAMKIKEKIPEALLVFVTPPTVEELERRLTGRGTETAQVIADRLARAGEEAEGMGQYDYILVNDTVEECVDHLHQIIVSEHSRVSRNAEFIADIQKQTKAFQK